MRAYRVAYDGRPYHGFQRQPDVDTVEGRLLSALGRLGVCDGDDVPAGYAAAGRTDAGVSARAQTVAFEAPDWLSPSAFNGELPADVRVWASADVPGTFHATHDATARTYTYYLYAPAADGTSSAEDATALGSDHEPARASDHVTAPPIDDDRWAAAVDALAGEHDYHNLTPDDSGTVRTIEIDWARDGDFLVVSLSAGGFCRQLVRRVIGLAASVARGRVPLSKTERVFSPDLLTGPEGVAPAPPQPLVLTDVRYPDVGFDVDETAAAEARAVFEAVHGRARTAARVTGHIRDGLSGSLDN